MRLTEVVRSSQRIVMASLPFAFQAEQKAIQCFSPSTGPPIKTFIFAPPADDANLYQAYAGETVKAILHLQATFPGVDLDDQVLIVVPDNAFVKELEPPLLEELDQLASLSLESRFELARAALAAATVAVQGGQVLNQNAPFAAHSLRCGMAGPQ